MPATSPGAKPTSWRCGTALDNGMPTTWFTTELANLRTAVRWAGDQGDLDVAAAIATYAACFGFHGRELRTNRVGRRAHRARQAPSTTPGSRPCMWSASNCYMAGRIDAAIRLQRGRPEGDQRWTRRRPVRRRRLRGRCLRVLSASRNGGSSGAAPSTRAVWAPTRSPGQCLLIGLAATGSFDEAMAAANGLIDAAEATGNPCVLSFALHAYGWAVHDTDPVRSLVALRRGLVIAQDSGNRANRVTTLRPLWPDLKPNMVTR